MKNYAAYIMANKPYGTLYVGCTNDLIRRVHEHKCKVQESFTEKYDISRLVYYEIYAAYCDAAQREKRFKNWPRQWKINLINLFNPSWRDLYTEICA